MSDGAKKGSDEHVVSVVVEEKIITGAPRQSRRSWVVPQEYPLPGQRENAAELSHLRWRACPGQGTFLGTTCTPRKRSGSTWDDERSPGRRQKRWAERQEQRKDRKIPNLGIPPGPVHQSLESGGSRPGSQSTRVIGSGVHRRGQGAMSPTRPPGPWRRRPDGPSRSGGTSRKEGGRATSLSIPSGARCHTYPCESRKTMETGGLMYPKASATSGTEPPRVHRRLGCLSRAG